MKLYKVTEIDSQLGTLLHWFSSGTKAKEFLRHMDKSATLESVEFPSGKKAIIDWLNTNYNRDNG